MSEILSKSPENITWKPTIPELSDALVKVFNGKDLESKEMINYIKEVYQLIDLIVQKAPSGVKEQLLSWPSTHETISYFIEKLKDIYCLKNITNDDKHRNSTAEIFDKYEELFERWWEWCVQKWKQIVSHYNPSRLNQLLN